MPMVKQKFTSFQMEFGNMFLNALRTDKPCFGKGLKFFSIGI